MTMHHRVHHSRRNHPSRGRLDRANPQSAALAISCDDCVMQCTSACADCVVSYVLRADGEQDELVLDHVEARAVRLLARAGLVPDLRYRATG